MGKFKELQILSDIDKSKSIQAQYLALNYPSIAQFIKNSFDADEEDKLYDLLMSLGDVVCSRLEH